ncbi:MAG: flavodoxin [Novosphingobium sp. 17-62-19]|uniref:flavodoxin family protein n=1 Tax=Novosphingobium sp. 17-62-19 TaxID=1970406 RepID=UPI000BDDC374|nr:flavodoxin family protein [Novosphingobium sp. 17-62-19]OZA21116.1 MAG: flavodoxin [Novosphingobium sp. 17-62-19]HQS95321.1 flavodoxin family protein [Novosphingobium sp.]
MAAGLLIIWHSRTGAARAMAEAARDGAARAAHCRILSADEAMPDDLLSAAGYLFCCPENLADMTGAMKEFFDRCYYPLLGRIEGRPYVTMIAAGSDGSGAERQIDRIVAGWRLRRVADGIIVCTKSQTPEEILAPKHVSNTLLQSCHDLGQAISEGLELGVF